MMGTSGRRRPGQGAAVTADGAIAVLGEALVDIVPGDAGAARAVPGGSGLNTALALARLGTPVSFCGSLSTDADGRALAECLAEEGVDLSRARRSDLPCPRVIVTPGEDGSPHYDLRLSGSALEDAPRAWEPPDDLLHLHATSFASTAGPQGAAALAAMKEARGHASTSFDPNIRTAVLPARAQTLALVAGRIRESTLVKVSEEDLGLLTPDPDALLREWRALGPRLLVVTRGAKGATALFEDHAIDVPSPAVKVRDTVGAGDTFMAALLASMRRDGALGPGRPALDAARIASWLAFAARAAALSCTRPGADPPRSFELERVAG